MESADPTERAVRFGELYRRWAGAIPLDDLSLFQAWYRILDRRGRRVFRRQVAASLLGPITGRDPPATRRLIREIDDWFPLDA